MTDVPPVEPPVPPVEPPRSGPPWPSDVVRPRPLQSRPIEELPPHWRERAEAWLAEAPAP